MKIMVAMVMMVVDDLTAQSHVNLGKWGKDQINSERKPLKTKYECIKRRGGGQREMGIQLLSSA